MKVLIVICLVNVFLNFYFYFASDLELRSLGSIHDPELTEISNTTLSLVSRANQFPFSNNSESENCIVRQERISYTEFQSMYNYVNYSRCPEIEDYSITESSDSLQVKCHNGNRPLYFSDYSPQLYAGSVKKEAKWVESNKVNDLSEFLFFKCSKESIHAIVLNRMKKAASDKANIIRNQMSPKSKNMNVLLIVTDVVSRNSYRINLPETIKFLESINDQTKFFKYYEFTKSGVPIARTVPNMAQIIFGKVLTDLVKVDEVTQKVLSPAVNRRHENQNHAIWTYFRKMGFVTMFCHDAIWDYVSKLTGQVIDADNVFTNIWKYLWSITGKTDFTNSQKCIGSKNFHQLSFEYAYQYFYNYKDNNKFAYVHLNAAHEKTGNIRTVDPDLVDFLNKTLDLITTRNESLALFLISDHGFKDMKKIQWDTRSFFDGKIGQTSLILSSDIVEEWNTDKFIEWNKHRLSARFDINLSLKQLAHFPYKQKFDLNELKTYKNSKVFSLLTEYIPDNRTCGDIAIPQINCICNWFEPVNLKEENEIQILNNMINVLKEYLGRNMLDNVKCEVLQDYEIVKYEKFLMKPKYEGWDTLLDLEINIGDKFLKIKANFCTEERIKQTLNILEGEKFPFIYFTLETIKVFLQISDIKIEQNCCQNLCDCFSKHI